jgi:DNA polymerase V
VLDQTNQNMGRGTLRFAAEGLQQSWKMRRENLTQGYTSAWGELVVVRA